ncbi:hypothetical protein [Sinimarinibacterium flocculans]|uniref:hypothetical protein n=1 Tax=Sinimarinibacterium flocculans TaxID=985250 RepID=UPI002E84216F|nr:hypothetical protein [Myxococcota bacterium]
MKRRTRVSQAALTRLGKDSLKLGQARGIVAPAPSKTTTVTLRLTGPWFELWEQLKAAVPGVGDAEIVRRGVAFYMALEGLDSKGKKPRATIQFHDENGELVTADLKTYVGLVETQDLSWD